MDEDLCPCCGANRMAVKEPFPARLIALRQGCGIGLRTLARRLGISPSYLCDIEAGTRLKPCGWQDAYGQALAELACAA